MAAELNISKNRQRLFIVLISLSPIVLLLFGLLTLEIGARTYFYVKYSQPGKSYGIWRPDEELGAIQAEHSYNSKGVTNNFGFRNSEDVSLERSKNDKVIIAYGGSTTFCYNLLAHESWPLQLQQRIRQAYPNQKIYVFNAGGVAWSLGHAYLRAKRDIPKIKPDYVIIYSGINEILNAHVLPLEGIDIRKQIQAGYFGIVAKKLDQAYWARRNLFSYKLWIIVLRPMLNKMFPLPKSSEHKLASDFTKQADPILYRNYLYILKKFIDLNRQHDVKTIFVSQIQGDGNFKNIHMVQYSQTALSALKNMGVEVVDARKLLKEYDGDARDLFWHTGVHYSLLGSEIFADFLFREKFASLLSP